MSWQTQLRGGPLPWLLDTSAPGVRYLALRDLLDLPKGTQSGAPSSCWARIPHWLSIPTAIRTSRTATGRGCEFGFPVFYITDLLQNVEALVAFPEGTHSGGYGRDRCLAGALDIIREKQDIGGRWSLEHDYAGKTWCDFGPKQQPNPWVTLRSLRVLKTVG